MKKTMRIRLRVLLFSIAFFSFIRQVNGVDYAGNFNGWKLVISDIILRDGHGLTQLVLYPVNACWVDTRQGEGSTSSLKTEQQIVYEVPEGEKYDPNNANFSIPLPPFLINQPADCSSWPINGFLVIYPPGGGEPETKKLFTIEERMLRCPNEDPLYQVDVPPLVRGGNTLVLTIRER